MAISKSCFTLVACATMALAVDYNLQAQVLSPEAVTTAPAATGESSPEAESEGFWSAIKMPKITMPKVTMPKISFPSWPKNEDGIAKSPFEPISTGMKKVSAGTKKAWEGTKEMFSFGEDNNGAGKASAQVARNNVSMWDRLRGKQPEPDGPRTVAEWMSQPRINP